MIAAIKSVFFSETLPRITTDIHSHLIPGIDDGAQDVETSITLIKALMALGYNKFITTPHIMEHRYPNSKKTIEAGLQVLREALLKEQLDVRVEVAAEYYLDTHFIALLEKGELMTFGDNYVLFELSYIHPFLELEQILFKMKSLGYRPVLAHPERYLYWHENLEHYQNLKSSGALFQMNLPSLSGYYGPQISKVAKYLLKEGLIDFLGSDTHKLRQVDALKSVQKSRVYRHIFENNPILNNSL